jgi:pseudaminic acid synthase
VNIGGVEIGPGHPCRVIAELSCNHNGSSALAARMIFAAKDAGCDFVKFQAYTPQELVDLRGDGPAPEPWGSQGWSMRDLYTKAQTPLHWLPDLFRYARAIGIVPFASFFGRESFAALRAVNCGAYKLASLDREHGWLRYLALSSGKPVIASVPTAADVQADGRVSHLYAPPGYPQTSVRLSHDLFHERPVGGWYDDAPFIGFSYHGRRWLPGVVAATLGASLIEAHFTLADEPGELEADVSLTEHHFAVMVERIREMETVRAGEGDA